MPELARSGAATDAERLAEALEAEGVEYLDLFELFRSRSETLYFEHDSHWTSRGAALAADAINSVLGAASAYGGEYEYATRQHTGDLYETRLGIDVSFYQGDIDWQAVADSGVKFAMIRCGYRGSSEGELFVDEKFEQNMQGAIDAGLDVGVYFFSQSTGAIEGAEEALFVLDLIKDYKITMPVAFDWEPLEESRAEDILDEELSLIHI